MLQLVTTSAISCFAFTAFLIALPLLSETRYVTRVEVFEEETAVLDCWRSSTAIRWKRRGEYQAWVDGISMPGTQLRIEYVSKEDEGEYHCVTADASKQVIETFHLVVQFSVMTPFSSELTVGEGSQATLKCFLVGFASYVFWIRSSSAKAMRTSHRITFSSGDGAYSMEIHDVRKTDEGFYTCRGEMPSERKIEGKIKLNVILPLRILPMKRLYTNVVGASLNVPCRVEKTDFYYKLEWVWSDSQNVRHYFDERGAVLSIQKIEEANEGTYTCVAERKDERALSRVEVSISLVVLDSVSEPTNVTLTFDCSWGFNLTWTVPFANSSKEQVAGAFLVRILTHDAGSPEAPVAPVYLKYVTKPHFELNVSGICNSLIVYWVEVQAINKTFNSSSLFAKVTSVRGTSTQDGLTGFCLRDPRFLFPVTPPRIQIKLVKQNCQCTIDQSLTSNLLDKLFRGIFRDFIELGNLAPLEENADNLDIRGRRRRAFLLVYRAPLKSSVTASDISKILNQMRQRLPMCTWLRNCLFWIDPFCEPVLWQGATCSCWRAEFMSKSAVLSILTSGLV